MSKIEPDKEVYSGKASSSGPYGIAILDDDKKIENFIVVEDNLLMTE